MREGVTNRKTNETDIRLKLELDGSRQEQHRYRLRFFGSHADAVRKAWAL